VITTVASSELRSARTVNSMVRPVSDLALIEPMKRERSAAVATGAMGSVGPRIRRVAVRRALAGSRATYVAAEIAHAARSAGSQ
jgi:hypothetical protein